jgi:hypothetical protein
MLARLSRLTLSGRTGYVGKSLLASGLVCYERQGYGSGGYHKRNPPQCDPPYSTIFCMRMHAQPA